MKVKVTINDLDKYMNDVHRGVRPKKSLNEFIQAKQQDPSVNIVADLSAIDFSKNKCNLCDGDLSGTILDNITFDGANVVLKGANLRGASMNGTRFKGGVNLANVEFGSIELNNSLFENCQLAEAKYDPGQAKVVMVKLTETQLASYFATDPKENINEYLKKQYGHQYKGLKIVADFSGMKIDKSFNGADLSGSNLEASTITGEIHGLVLRDCYTHNTVFKDCRLVKADLRGTCLATDGKLLAQAFKAVSFEGNVYLDSPKFSMDSNIQEASNKGLITSNDSIVTPIFDPCYSKDVPDETRIYKGFTKEDVKRYCDYVQKSKVGSFASSDLPDFNTYMNMQDNEIADFSSLDLRGCDFSDTKFNKCNFSFTTLSGCNFNDAEIKHCNFSGANMSNRYVNSQFTRLAGLEDRFKKFWNVNPGQTSMQGANFEGCDFTWADMTSVNASRAQFNNVKAINLDAPNFKLDGEAHAHQANFAGAYLPGLNANALQAKNADFSQVNGNGGNLEGAYLGNGKFDHSQMKGVNFKDSYLGASSFFKANLNNADLSKTFLENSRIGADVSSAKIEDSFMLHSDVSNIKHESNKDPTISNIMGGPIQDVNAIDLQEKQNQQEQNNKKKSIYNKYAVLLIGLAIVATLAVPFSISIIAPALISAAALQSLATAATVSISAFTVDAVSESVFGKSIGISKVISNIFGASKLIEVQNHSLQEEQMDLSNERRNMAAERTSLIRSEKEITKVSEKRYQDSLAPKVEKKKFTERLKENVGRAFSGRGANQTG